MALALVLLVAGAIVLYGAAELLLRGAARIASRLGISALAVGAASAGLDLEAIATSLTGAGRGDTELAAGAAFGGVLFLWTVGLGLSLAVGRRSVPSPSTSLVLAPGGGILLAALAISDRYLDRFEGLLLVIGYAGYLYLTWRIQGKPADEEDGAEPEDEMALEGILRPTVPALAGVALLYAGGWMLVEGGARLSAATGLAAGFVGAALLGALVGLDDVLAQVLRRSPLPAADDLLAMLVAMTTGVLGLAALLRPLTLDTGTNLAFLGISLVYAIVAVAWLVWGRAGWRLGVALLGLYVAWLVYASGS